MDSVNKTLYIPLYGKALVSKKGIILKDKKAEEIWGKANFNLSGKAKSKWLAYYMGMRSKVFDNFVEEKLIENPNSILLHLGCGLDSRVERVNKQNALWVDIDVDAVILERKHYYLENDSYKMVSADITDTSFILGLPNAERAIVLLEGVSMYLTNENVISYEYEDGEISDITPYYMYHQIKVYDVKSSEYSLILPSAMI